MITIHCKENKDNAFPSITTKYFIILKDGKSIGYITPTLLIKLGFYYQVYLYITAGEPKVEASETFTHAIECMMYGESRELIDEASKLLYQKMMEN